MARSFATFGQASADFLNTRVWSWTAHALSTGTVEAPQLQRLRDVWTRCQDDFGRPWLARFNPSDLGPVLRHVALVDVVRGAASARYRLVGPALIRLYGGDLTGRAVADCYSGAILDEVMAAYRHVIERREPLYSTREFQILGRSFGYRRLLAPLTRDGEAVSHIVLGIVPARRDLTEAAQWRSVEAERAFREAVDDVEPSPSR